MKVSCVWRSLNTKSSKAAEDNLKIAANLCFKAIRAVCTRRKYVMPWPLRLKEPLRDDVTKVTSLVVYDRVIRLCLIWTRERSLAGLDLMLFTGTAPCPPLVKCSPDHRPLSPPLNLPSQMCGNLCVCESVRLLRFLRHHAQPRHVSNLQNFVCLSPSQRSKTTRRQKGNGKARKRREEKKRCV